MCFSSRLNRDAGAYVVERRELLEYGVPEEIAEEQVILVGHKFALKDPAGVRAWWKTQEVGGLNAPYQYVDETVHYYQFGQPARDEHGFHVAATKFEAARKAFELQASVSRRMIGISPATLREPASLMELFDTVHFLKPVERYRIWSPPGWFPKPPRVAASLRDCGVVLCRVLVAQSLVDGTNHAHLATMIAPGARETREEILATAAEACKHILAPLSTFEEIEMEGSKGFYRRDQGGPTHRPAAKVPSTPPIKRESNFYACIYREATAPAKGVAR